MCVFGESSVLVLQRVHMTEYFYGAEHEGCGSTPVRVHEDRIIEVVGARVSYCIQSADAVPRSSGGCPVMSIWAMLTSTYYV